MQVAELDTSEIETVLPKRSSIQSVLNAQSNAESSLPTRSETIEI